MVKVVYVLEVISPIYIVVGLGYFLVRMGIVSERFKSDLSKYVFYIALPLLLFMSISQSNVFTAFDEKLLISTILTVSLIFFVNLLIILALPINNDKKGPFIQGSYRCNLAYIGIPVVLNAFGKDVLPVVSIFIAVIAPIFNMFAVLSLTLPYRAVNKNSSMSRVVYEVIKNPLVISCSIGMLISLIGQQFGGISYPSIMENSLNFIAKTSSPLALICVGASLSFKDIGKNFYLISFVSVIKLIIMPLVAFILLRIFHTTTLYTCVGTILLSTPTAVASHIMTKAIGGDDRFSASIVMFTHVLSVVTVPLWLLIVT